MEEILYKNLISSNRKKQDFFVSEAVKDSSCITSMERKITYYVRDKFPSSSAKHIFISTIYDSRTGAKKIVYKIVGVLSVVINDAVFPIAYRHFLKIEVRKESSQE